MQTIAVIGAGMMGSGISQTAAQFGHRVLLSDVKLELAEKAKEIGYRGDYFAQVASGGAATFASADDFAILMRQEDVSDVETAPAAKGKQGGHRNKRMRK